MKSEAKGSWRLVGALKGDSRTRGQEGKFREKKQNRVRNEEPHMPNAGIRLIEEVPGANQFTGFCSWH